MGNVVSVTKTMVIEKVSGDSVESTVTEAKQKWSDREKK